MTESTPTPERVSWIPNRKQLPGGILGAVDAVVCTVAAGGLAVIALALIVQVVARYLVGQPTVWSEELSVSLFVWVSMLAIALGVRRGEHLTLDLFSKRLSQGAGRVLAIVIAVLGVVTFLTIAYFCLALLGPANRQDLAGISTGLGIPAKTSWVYAAVPVGMFLSAVFTVERLVLVLRGKVEVMSADADLQVLAELDAEKNRNDDRPAAGGIV